MSKRRLNNPIPKYRGNGKTYAQILDDMLQSDAYKDLTYHQQCLYVAMRQREFGYKKPREDFKDVETLQDEDLFYFPFKAACEDYGLYAETNHPGFYRDVDALVEHGFIERVSSGKGRGKQMTIYRYSPKWYGWEKGG